MGIWNLDYILATNIKSQYFTSAYINLCVCFHSYKKCMYVCMKKVFKKLPTQIRKNNVYCIFFIVKKKYQSTIYIIWSKKIETNKEYKTDMKTYSENSLCVYKINLWYINLWLKRIFFNYIHFVKWLSNSDPLKKAIRNAFLK